MKAKVGFVTVVAIVVAAGCGSAPSPQQKAQSAATTACAQIFGLASTIVTGDSVTSATAVKTLNEATSSANRAAQLDQQKWDVLAGTVRDIARYLEQGPRSSLAATLDDLAYYCRPLVQPGSSS